jgi:hypothetical protein
MTKKIHVEYWGMKGSGRNLTEAKKDAGRKAEAALSGDYTPTLLHAYGHSILVYREPIGGWAYLFLPREPEALRTPLYNGVCFGNADYAETVRRARTHLAQRVFRKKGQTGLDVVDPLDRREHLSWVRFQYCFQAWLDDGEKDHNKIHDLACRDAWPEGVEPWREK